MIKKYYNKYKYIKYKKKRDLVTANLYIQCQLKNTLFSLTKSDGNVLKQWSTKSLKKTKFKKNTPYNIQLIVYKIHQFIKIKKIQKMNFFFKGTGLAKRNTLKNFHQRKFRIGFIFDQTHIPFNGCRQKKQKRR